LKMEATRSSETPVNIYQTTWRHFLEYLQLQICSCFLNISFIN
jgi:hypothetical protein